VDYEDQLIAKAAQKQQAARFDTVNCGQAVQNVGLQGTRVRCECHDCTQARWQMSMCGQLQGGAIAANLY